jgi:hypothetical protein
VISPDAFTPSPTLTVEILSGSLPPGVHFTQPPAPIGSYAMPHVAGKPTQAGTFPVTFRVTDYLGGSDTATYTVHVVQPPVLDVTKLVFIGEIDIPFTGTFAQSFGNASNYWISATPSAGLTSVGGSTVLAFGAVILSPPTGPALLTGTPSVSGSFNVTFLVQSYTLINGTTAVVTGGRVSQTVTVTIHPKLILPTLPEQSVSPGTSFSLALQQTGGVPGKVQFTSTGALPPGLTLDSSTGLISGTLIETTVLGSVFALTVTVKDALNATSTAQLAFRSVAGVSPGLSTAAIVGIAIGATVFVVACAAGIYIWHRMWTSGKFHAPLNENASESMYFKF